MTDDGRSYRLHRPGQTIPTIHDPRDCRFCENDPEQCHADMDCELRAWANGHCGPHQPNPKSYH